MRSVSCAVLSVLLLASTLPASAAASRTRHHAFSSRAVAKHTAKPKLASQRTIDDDRATQIQAALIKAGYLTGTPSGRWDSESTAAMQKVQADNGWQTKLVPDSRALIKLGLGPAGINSSSLSLAAQPASPGPDPSEAFVQAQ
jgi:hypothetical protein